ncbi:MAG: bifunctional phosphoglucose/phosphomannose isomerase [Actinobacteria bacterium]|nr:bifunctional phosphoglucose/phosphomannose isomerase [Actinomycetota bacterium]
MNAPDRQALLNQLDDTAAIRALDSQDQFGMVAGLPGQMFDAYEAGSKVALDHGGEVGGIAVAGMGGSAIGADVIASVYDAELPSPMVTVRGYNLPHWISSRSLVFVVSYSGNTEETISCLNEALERGCRIICLSTGGKVGRIAAENNLPFIEVPSSLQPRAAMGWLSVPIAACLENLGLVEAVEEDVRETAEVLKGCIDAYGLDSLAADNPAKQLAADLFERIPVIYGSEVTAVAALRWKCQINENAKALAFNHQFPELNHNEIVGWEYPAEDMERFRVIYLTDGKLHPQNVKRMNVTAELLENYVGGIRRYASSGDCRLARLLSSVNLGDYLSLYLAVLYGIDPSPVERIENLKRQLA